MCCRCYVEYLKDKKLKQIYDQLQDKDDIKTEGELFPGDNAVIVANNKDLNIGVFKMKWGYTLGKKLVFNARCESLEEKEIFKDGINMRRCVLPINNYFEWKKDDKKKYLFKDEDSIMYLLGIYRFEDGKPVFTVLTKDASLKLSIVHDRMPVVIRGENVRKWLEKDADFLSIIKESVDDLYFEPYDKQ